MATQDGQIMIIKRSTGGISFLYFSLFLIVSAVLLVPLWLTPSSSGIGTHQQLGLPPCPFWTFLHIKCPTCGLTTSFTSLTSGNMALAFKSHLIGPLFYGLFSLLALLLLFGTFNPSWLGRLFLLKKTRFMVDVFLTLWLTIWIYSILN